MEQNIPPPPPSPEQPNTSPAESAPAEGGIKQFCLNALAKVMPGRTRGDHPANTGHESASGYSGNANARSMSRREARHEAKKRFKAHDMHTKLSRENARLRSLEATHGSPDIVEDKHPGRANRSARNYLSRVDGLSEKVDKGRITEREEQQAGRLVERSARGWLVKASQTVQAKNEAAGREGFSRFSYFMSALERQDSFDGTPHEVDFRQKLRTAVAATRLASPEPEALAEELQQLQSTESGRRLEGNYMSGEDFIDLLRAADDEDSYRRLLREKTGLAARYDLVKSPSNAGKEDPYALTDDEEKFGERLAEAKQARGEAYFRGFLVEAGLTETVDRLDEIRSDNRDNPDLSFQRCLAMATEDDREEIVRRLNQSGKIVPPGEYHMGNLGPNKNSAKGIGNVMQKFLDAPEEDTPRLLRAIFLHERKADNAEVFRLLDRYMHDNYAADSLLRHPEQFEREVAKKPFSPYERRARFKTLKQYERAELAHARLTAELERIKGGSKDNKHRGRSTRNNNHETPSARIRIVSPARAEAFKRAGSKLVNEASSMARRGIMLELARAQRAQANIKRNVNKAAIRGREYVHVYRTGHLKIPQIENLDLRKRK